MVKYGKKKTKPAVPLMPLHKYSLEYEKSKQQANEKRLQLLDEATAYCIENGAEPKDAVKLKRFESLTKDQIRYHMTRSARNERDILTNTERDRVFEWMKKRSDEGDEPVTESMLGEEILKILKARLRGGNSGRGLGRCVVEVGCARRDPEVWDRRFEVQRVLVVVESRYIENSQQCVYTRKARKRRDDKTKELETNPKTRWLVGLAAVRCRLHRRARSSLSTAPCSMSLHTMRSAVWRLS